MRLLRRYRACLAPVLMLAVLALVVSGGLRSADAAALAAHDVATAHGTAPHAPSAAREHDHAGPSAAPDDCSPVGNGCSAPFPAPEHAVLPAAQRSVGQRVSHSACSRLSRQTGFDPPPPRSFAKITL
ncbi:hypothetical protein PMES_01847 [Profundibacterium mesophilum KAUST100406-0324]|uniref:Secreted protein n=2 Tax=Profundibacterium TaxID=1258570 RepID=A0A921NUZ8_9RHOB|nr:hypothetical protein PMES_01847 [Profundibacterium mesophilum KAUST100406-0324]